MFRKFLFFSFFVFLAQAQETLHTLYGDFVITEPVLEELMHNSFVERLKSIHQYGINSYAIHKPEFNRYIHSIGVMVLLRKYEASVCEQIAGLLHDVSHTVFSHVADRIFDCHAQKSSYQDNIHENFLAQTTIPYTLEKYEFSIAQVYHKNAEFLCLEQSLPDICADRLEYNLRGGLVAGIITEKDIKNILDALHFKDGVWYFTDKKQAALLGHVSCYLPENIWFSPENQFVDHYASEALKRAAQLGYISYNDIHFSIDDIVWHKLCSCDDAIIKECLCKMQNWQTAFVVSDASNYDFWCASKSQAINPWVQTADGLQRLTAVDPVYAAEFERARTVLTPGIYFKENTFIDVSC